MENKGHPKVKMFFWLALHKRIWTAERRWRHGLQDSATCILCDQQAETVSHLLLGNEWLLAGFISLGVFFALLLDGSSGYNVASILAV